MKSKKSVAPYAKRTLENTQSEFVYLMVLYLVVVRGLVRLCDPESNICRGSSPWQV
jgi:hypothetical protein